MTTRISERDLKNLCDRINECTGNKSEAYTRGEDGKFTANVGTYTLSAAYGGWRLQKISNESGGVTTITSGYIPKRELYYQMQTFLAGIAVNS